MPPPTTNAAGQRVPSGAVPPQQTLQQRLQTMVQHQQFFWWVGHVIIVLATLFHAFAWFRFNYNTKMALFWYRLAFLGAVGSYGVVVHKMFFRVLSLWDVTDEGRTTRGSKTRRSFLQTLS